MFAIESYVTPILLSYVDKYVKDFKPADAQVSLWGGGVVLHNLVLKEDVLQRGVSLPFRLVSGRIHQLHIQVPWTKIMSEPIVVTIDTIECVLSLNPPAGDATQTNNDESHKEVVETPPGYMQALVRRIVSNIAVKVNHLILKYVNDDIVLSLNVKQMSVESVAPDWSPAFTDISHLDPILRRLVRLEDLTLCLDQTESDGKIHIYQEPLLYRCQLTFRISTRLVSATTRRSQYLDIQILSSNLAWSVTSDQLLLLIRLARERVPDEVKSSMKKAASTSPQTEQSSTFSPNGAMNQTEASHRESWSDWAWSWLPSWSDREGMLEESPLCAEPVPLYLAAHIDSVSVVYKVMEEEQANKKRARAVLELKAECFAIKSSICNPTLTDVSLGMKYLKLESQGKCVCGHLDANTVVGEPTVYLLKSQNVINDDFWKWPEDDNHDTMQADASTIPNTSRHQSSQMSANTTEAEGQSSDIPSWTKNKFNETMCRNYKLFWQKLEPIFYLEHRHERTPPTLYTNPYDNPPTDFEHSDWREEFSVNLTVEPIEIRICMGLIHRVDSILDVLKKMPPVLEKERSMRALTVEECEALTENLPCRVINMDLKDLKIAVNPWNHSLSEPPSPTPLALYIDIPETNLFILMPLYPNRVCSAACQLRSEDTSLSRGSRLHFTSTMRAIEVSVANPQSSHVTRSVARIDLKIFVHFLLNQKYFSNPDTILASYSALSKDLSVSGSLARLQAVYEIVNSLLNNGYSSLLKSSTLPQDALNDQEAAIVDLTSEDLSVKGFFTKTTSSHTASVQTAKATILHAPGSGELKQAWLFSAPDVATPLPYLRLALQTCDEPNVNTLKYISLWTELTAVCIDPLLVAWLAYRPQQLPGHEPPPAMTPRVALSTSHIAPSTSHMTRRRSTPPLQSMGVPPCRSGSGSELIHTPRPRSQASGSGTKTGKASTTPEATKQTRDGKRLIRIYTTLKNILVNVEIGFIVVYVTPNSASALDSATLRDALERHTAAGNKVLVASLGQFSVQSNFTNKQLWRELHFDGVTALPTTNFKLETEDSFPWRICFSDVTCYTLQVHVSNRNIDRNRSQLRVPSVIVPKTVLDLLTTTVTLSVVTKRKASKKDKGESTKPESASEKREKYFTEGLNFKPSTITEFLRGPAQRVKDTQNEPSTSHQSKENEGPLVYLGLCLYADTPPLYIRINQDQCDVVTMAIHAINHLVSLLRREPMQPPRTAAGGSQGGGSSHSVMRSISELEEPGRSTSDTHSDRSKFVPIFESPVEPGLKVKTSFWFQWVKHRITLVATSPKIMFTMNIEDIISTVDFQTNYNQFKFKIASASLKHHERRYNEWHPSALRGRVMEGREPTESADGNRFLTVTITQAEVASLPANWKEDFNPKFMDKSDTNQGNPDANIFHELRALKASAVDNRPPQLFTTSPLTTTSPPLTTTTTDEMEYIWEVNAVVAPLEGLLTPNIMRNAALMLRKFRPVFACAIPDKSSITSNRSNKWPYVFINAGGFRILLSFEDSSLPGDNTLVITVNKVFVNPHPENPILRTTPSGSNEGAWVNVNSGPEGRQYETLVHNLTVQSAQYAELLDHELTSMEMNANGANPALMWAQPPVTPTLTTIVHPLQMSCLVAPAVYVGGSLASNFAVEVNLLSDCNIDVDLSQLNLFTTLTAEINPVVKSIFHRMSDIEQVQCAYGMMILSQETITPRTSDVKPSVTGETRNRSNQSFDSDFESAEVGYRRQASVAFADETADSSDNIDFYVTAGNVRTTLHAVDNNSSLLSRLRLPSEPRSSNESDIVEPKRKKEKIHNAKSIGSLSGTMSSTNDKELKPTQSTTDLLQTEVATSQPVERRIPLLTMTLHQPNIYFWRRRSQKCLQVSLFNAWLGLGSSPSQGGWNLALFHTKKGQPDLFTEIPPTLLRSKLLLPVTTGNFNAGNVAAPRGSLNVAIERPCMVEISIERIERLKSINDLVRMHVQGEELQINTSAPKSPLFKIRKLMMDQGVEIIKVCTKQIGVRGSEGTAGWDECSLQITATSRYDRLLVKGLITALQVTAAPNDRNRRLILHPLVLGIDTKMTWEAWQRAESDNMTEEPIVNLRVDLDRVTVDLVPDNLKAWNRLADATRTAFNIKPPTKSATSTDRVSFGKTSTVAFNEQNKFEFSTNKTPQSRESLDYHYKDDLRSGVFKIMTGNQLPMAYQIMLQEDAVAWRYPHPRAITRFVVLPLPDQNEEVHSVLEYYSSTLSRWEPHTWFKLPIADAREVTFSVTPPDAVFASMWRCRTCNGIEEQPPFEFESQHFTFGPDHAVPDQSQDTPRQRTHTGVSPQALSGVLRVDSYFSPQHLSRYKLAVQMTSLDLHLYNKLPHFSRNGNPVKGHYINKQQTLRSHRVMSLVTRDNVVHAHLGASAGKLVMLHTKISSDVLESSTGLMERFLHECRIQAAVALPEELKDFRLRLCSTPIMVLLQMPRLRALIRHVNKWCTALSEFQRESTGIAPADNFPTTIPADSTQSAAQDLPTTLEGLISLWVKNECSVSIRMGQESTDEYVLLPSGAMLAYRWRNPAAPKRLRFCLETGDAHNIEWSESVSFQDKEMRVRIVRNGEPSAADPSSEVCIYTRVEDYGVRMCMRLFGRMRLANMLREKLVFKIQARQSDSSPWTILTFGEMGAESLNPTVLCASDCELTLKIRFHRHNASWSGEIPLKECTNENLAWLVKIPCGNNVPYLAAWCRVVRGRIDGQILATLWPLYTLQSHLPLDLDVQITTILDSSVSEEPSAPLVQEVSGRGECTHLMTPGTLAAKHSLTLRYKNLETPVTRDAILLNYNSADTPFFDKHIPVNKIDEIIAKITQWLDSNKSGSSTAWPYSCVARYWAGQWISAVNQPRSDLNITFSRVCAGGDCSLQLQLRPAAIFCNGAPLPLTLRFHDASPLCKLEPGEVVAGPASILTKHFFVSLEMGHIMYMSIELRLWQSEPGRYAPLPPGCVAIDRPARIIIPCKEKVIFLTFFYELKNDINVFGFTSTYRLINRLGTKILVAGAVSRVGSASAETRPPSYEVIEEANATGPGTQLTMFWLMDPWEDGDLDSITIYLWIALPDDTETSPAHLPVPIVLGKNTTRNAFELRHPANRSIPVAVTQQILDDCGVITIAEDPYPQYYIQNYTQMSLFVGEPLSVPSDNGSWYQNKVPSECPGLQWYRSIEPASAVHYTTPSYCERHLANNSTCQPPMKLPFLAFADASDKSKTTVEWSPPAAITDGEQLLQVPGLKTIKLRVTVHPHTTLIELQNVDQNDISASEIRQRLQETSFEPLLPVITEIYDNTLNLEKALNQIHEVDLLLQCASDNSADVEINDSPDAAHHEHGISKAKPDLGEKPSESLGSSNNATSAPSTSRQYASTSSTVTDNLRSEESAWPSQERVRCVLEGVVLSLSSAPHLPPLLVTHLDHVALHLTSTQKEIVVRTSVAAIQVDNREFESGQYDFAVVATTRQAGHSSRGDRPRWPCLANMFGDMCSLPLGTDSAGALLRINIDMWSVEDVSFTELTEMELKMCPLALYIEDAYVTALATLADRFRMAGWIEAREDAAVPSNRLLRLRYFHIHDLDLNLTLHTSVHMYIALDHSPLHLTEFKMHDLVITNGDLIHALTVHYLSAAVLAAGWVVGGLELLGAPGALAVRVGNATGGVRGVAYTVAAALLRSVSAWAGSLARNLDLLTGDEEHAQRAAANRRNPPQSLFSGLLFGLTNLAVNMLDGVSTAAGLRRGLVGAFAKPLSATADLLAFAGHGLLHQTGWESMPQTLPWTDTTTELGLHSEWQRECVLWAFRMLDLQMIAGYRVLLNNKPLMLILTSTYLVVVDPDSDKVVDMVNFENCQVAPYRGSTIELTIKRRPAMDPNDPQGSDQYQANIEAMARVARYTGALGSHALISLDDRRARLLPAPGHAHALHAALSALAHSNSDTHFRLF